MFKCKLVKVDRALDRQEQFSRWNCFNARNWQRNPRKHRLLLLLPVVINILHIKDINRSHSLGNKIFEMIFKNKRKSKGKPISLTKTQIKARMEQLQKDREENIFWRTWSNNGKILYIGIKKTVGWKYFIIKIFKSLLMFCLFYNKKMFFIICFLFLFNFSLFIVFFALCFTLKIMGIIIEK